MIARLDVAHALAGGLDNAGCLMAVDGRQVATPTTLGKKNITVADGASSQPDLHFANVGFSNGHIFDNERMCELATDRSFHELYFLVKRIDDLFFRE